MGELVGTIADNSAQPSVEFTTSKEGGDPEYYLATNTVDKQKTKLVYNSKMTPPPVSHVNIPRPFAILPELENIDWSAAPVAGDTRPHGMFTTGTRKFSRERQEFIRQVQERRDFRESHAGVTRIPTSTSAPGLSSQQMFLSPVGTTLTDLSVSASAAKASRTASTSAEGAFGFSLTTSTPVPGTRGVSPLTPAHGHGLRPSTQTAPPAAAAPPLTSSDASYSGPPRSAPGLTPIDPKIGLPPIGSILPPSCPPSANK